MAIPYSSSKMPLPEAVMDNTVPLPWFRSDPSAPLPSRPALMAIPDLSRRMPLPAASLNLVCWETEAAFCCSYFRSILLHLMLSGGQ